MKLFILTQEVNNSYDTYDSCVVAAETVEQARQMNPDGKWGRPYTAWANTPDQVQVEWIGTAKEGTESGIILSSFNAG